MDEDTCAICYDTNDVNSIVLCSGEGWAHRFHRDCIKLWLNRNIHSATHFTCPMCTRLIPKITIEALPANMWESITLTLKKSGTAIVENPITSIYVTTQIVLAGAYVRAYIILQGLPPIDSVAFNDEAGRESVFRFILIPLIMLMLHTVMGGMPGIGNNMNGGGERLVLCVNKKCVNIAPELENIFKEAFKVLNKHIPDKNNYDIEFNPTRRIVGGKSRRGKYTRKISRTAKSHKV
jgi:hypothetical protein